MTRPVLPESQVHPAVRASLGGGYPDTLAEVQQALQDHDVVVVGMRQNPFVARTCKMLDAQGIEYHFLSYGSYLKEWRRRLAIKMWSGWSTFPQVFVQGLLVGGYKDVKALLERGEFTPLLEDDLPAKATR